jgi:hypothetical protein
MPSNADLAAFAAYAAASSTTSPAAPSPASDAMELLHARSGQKEFSEAQTASAVDHIERQYALSVEDRAALLSGKDLHVAQSTVTAAKAMKARLLADTAWVESYLAGDQTARRTMMQLNVRLSCQDVREG